MTKVYSIFERIGTGGGGKIKAVFHRMNALSEMRQIDPIVLNLDHNLQQKLNFAELQASGIVATGVRNLTVPEACYPLAVAANVKPFAGFPKFDRHEQSGSDVEYFLDGRLVMSDKVKHTRIGTVTKRSVPFGTASRLYTLIDGEVHQMVQRNADETIEATDFVKSLPIRWQKSLGRNFVIGKNLITGQICRMERIYGQNIFQQIAWDGSVVFFDGVTSAYLSPITTGKRVLVLHADHRGPDGEIVPRSRYLIENFKGEAIVTSTKVHRTQIWADVTPSAEVYVIPHFCEKSDAKKSVRRHLVTVSRLDLVGKPIPECIEAFCQIMGEFPEVDYLIYGTGTGHRHLAAMIEGLGCGDRVRLMGYTSEPLAVFQSALASVYPTTTEGFGLSILEALSNGCPVITYDVNYGPREMIAPGINGELVPPGDVGAIMQAMRKVLLHPEHYQIGIKTGLERYSRDAYLANYRDFIAKLTNVAQK